jgi:SGNH hydrolase-like domain, acetyltransferase AlgX
MDISKRRELRVLGYPIIPQSRLLMFIKQKYRIYDEAKKAAVENRDQQEQPGSFSEDTYLDIERGRLEFFNLSYLRDGRFQPRIDYILQSIAEMDALLKSRNIKLVVAIYPDEFQINEKVLQAVLDKYKLRRENYDLNPGQSILKPFLDSKGIPFVDFADRFRAEGKKQDLYLLRDTHWNAAGNQLAADILFDDLSRRIGNIHH